MTTRRDERMVEVFFVPGRTAMDAQTLVHVRASAAFRDFLDRGCRDIDYQGDLVPGGINVMVTFICPAEARYA